MTKTEIQRLINLLRSLYPNSKMKSDADTIAAWEETFKNQTFENVRKALIKCNVNSRFVPTFQEIIEQLPPVIKVLTFERSAEEPVRVAIVFNDSVFPFKFDKPAKAKELVELVKNTAMDLTAMQSLHAEHTAKKLANMKNIPKGLKK